MTWCGFMEGYVLDYFVARPYNMLVNLKGAARQI